MALFLGFITVMVYKVATASSKPPAIEQYNGEESLAIVVHKFIAPHGQVGWIHVTGNAFYIPESITSDISIPFSNIRSLSITAHGKKLDDRYFIHISKEGDTAVETFSIPKAHVDPLLEWLRKHIVAFPIQRNNDPV